MEISYPTNWGLINLETETNPNKFGESLRNYCFIGNAMEMGCYETFEVHKSFRQIKSGKEFKRIKELILGKDNEYYENEKPTVYIREITQEDCEKLKEDFGFSLTDPYKLTVAWFWDGDGTLLVGYNNKLAINTDCKKSYGWEWVK